ncbi:GntR family transcriptional regulator [Prosthecomicrobium hirschii]|uniref:GntR family transcriptional regulator n=1 Tax=Prosthecodimorpha hirschii TaxID=665126 RepID=UPI000B0ABEA8|nr:GntR family transcriptional regulator [Prosthecomicrobium hirschii]
MGEVRRGQFGERGAVAKRSGSVEGLGIDRPKSLAVLVAERLREAIVSTELQLGQALSEEQIAATMNVSRTPVREALTMLQLQGLIDIKPQRGSFVFKPDAEDIAALVAYRHILEMAAAPLALSVAPEATLRDLAASVAMMEAARAEDHPLDFARADSLFHQAFFTHCGNRYLSEAYGIASGRLAALRAHLAAPLTMHRSRAHADHLDMIEAFRAVDRKRLLAVLGRHILAMTDNYVGALKETGSVR